MEKIKYLKKRVLVKDAPSHSKRGSLTIYNQSIELGSLHSQPPHRPTFPIESLDKETKYRFEGSTPSHSHPHMNKTHGFCTKSGAEVPLLNI